MILLMKSESFVPPLTATQLPLWRFHKEIIKLIHIIWIDRFSKNVLKRMITLYDEQIEFRPLCTYSLYLSTCDQACLLDVRESMRFILVCFAAHLSFRKNKWGLQAGSVKLLIVLLSMFMFILWIKSDLFMNCSCQSLTFNQKDVQEMTSYRFGMAWGWELMT